MAVIDVVKSDTELVIMSFLVFQLSQTQVRAREQGLSCSLIV
jgi:hypothetical protein